MTGSNASKIPIHLAALVIHSKGEMLLSARTLALATLVPVLFTAVTAFVPKFLRPSQARVK